VPKPDDEASSFDNLDDLFDPKNDADPSAPKPPSASDIATAALSSLPDLSAPTAGATPEVPDAFGADAFPADLASDVPAIAADEEPGDRATADSPAPDAPATGTDEEGEEAQAEGEPAGTAEEEAKDEEKGEEEEKEKKPTLVERLSKLDPYMVMLIVAFVAMFIACVVLFSELGSYKFITKPQAIKKAISAAPVQPAPATTTAVA
jgi:hypothetical protein